MFFRYHAAMTIDTDALLDRRRLKRRLYLWRGIALLAVLGALFAVAAAWDDGALGGRDHIARLNIDGVIGEDRWLDKAVREVAEDDRAKALIVRINSPGGSTFGGEALYTSLRLVAAKKPVVAVIGTLGASAGYLIALAGDRIYVRETTITGSIGVIFQTAEFSKLMEKLGVSAESITSGALKDEPSMTRPLSPAGRAAIKGLVDETHAWFVNLVAERRKLPRETVAGLADGRVYSGRAALDYKLVDALGGEPEAVRWLEQNRALPKDLWIHTVKVGPPSRFLDDLGSRLFRKIVLSERLSLDGLVSVWHADGQ